MRIFKFNNWKYGKELMIDAGAIDRFPGYFFEEEPHVTDFYELIFFEAGSGYLLLDDKKIALSAGMIVFISPFRKRRWFVKKKTLNCRFLLFREEFLREYLKNELFLCALPFFYGKFPHFLNPEEKEWKMLSDLFNQMMSEIDQYKTDSDAYLRSQLVYLLQALSRAYTRQYDIPVGIKEQSLALRFRYLLEREINAAYGVVYYAEKLFTSRVTLNKYCNVFFGINAGDLIRQRLVFEIKSLLLYTNLTINEIADSLGFQESSNLSRFFRHLTGLTPSEYRKTYQGGLYFG